MPDHTPAEPTRAEHDDDAERAARSAAIYAQVTGSRGATYTVERVDWTGGQRKVISSVTATAGDVSLPDVPRAGAVWGMVGASGSTWEILATDADPDGPAVSQAAQRWADASGAPVFVHASPHGLSDHTPPGDLPYVGVWQPHTPSHRGRVTVARDADTGHWTVRLDGAEVARTNPHGETAARGMATGLSDALTARNGRCDAAGNDHPDDDRATTAIAREIWADGPVAWMPALVPVCADCRAEVEQWTDAMADRAEHNATVGDALS